ncbi:hypothetical protein GCM10023194_36480 [Planotetraspora phitsanulokensis]|uniref:Uncharacterized protein n=1 Tax=Planotetraspora phitsanulokensis TaxID=575192 RepID=A0A8J3UBX5_9ACTN|nr:hypothetical protein [Planotetraspora phitsanulokensis]GII36225.1 hypothetical protein Pph01_12280 [Planotetraspora phitsanulokensis]
MSVLEDSYRWVLRLLPAPYRAEREEEMVSAFLEGAQHGEAGLDDQRPRWMEIASVAALAVRLRVGGPGAPPRSFLWGEAVRRVALLGLVFWTMIGFLSAAQALIAYGILADALPDDVIMGIGYAGSPDRLRHVLADLVPLMWAGSLGALVLGRPRMAKAVAVAALVLPHMLVPPVFPGGWEIVARWACMVLPAAVTVPALVIGFHRDAPPPPLPRGQALRMVALPAVPGILLSLVVTALSSLSRADTVPVTLLVQASLWVDVPGLACVSLLIVTVWCLARRRTSGPTALAAAILTVPAVLSRAATLHPGAADSITETINLVGGLQIALLLAGGITLVALSTQALRTVVDGDLTGIRGQHG